MLIKVLSWNIKSFAGCVSIKGNQFDIIKQVINEFDLICIYEVPNSSNGTKCLKKLVKGLNKLGKRTYQAFSVATNGLNKENDLVGVVYETGAVAVTDTTSNRRPSKTGGRESIYFDVTANGRTCEFCAWHAPEPSNKSTGLIAQGWQNILDNTLDHNKSPLTAVVMGDFNGVLTIPKTKRKAGYQFTREITSSLGTTLKPSMSSQKYIDKYRTTNVYDQFYVDRSLFNNYNNAGKSGVYHVMNKLATNAAPFTGLYKNKYNSNHAAYLCYYGISDHLPVALTLDF